jgi:hypothetical protein
MSAFAKLPKVLQNLLPSNGDDSKKLLAISCARTKPGKQFWKNVVKYFLELLDLRCDEDCETRDAIDGIKNSSYHFNFLCAQCQ